jgi:DNA-binding LacI/PurR family transcriptional regulator
MAGMGTTQRTIAERLGISRSLVSRALNGSAEAIRAKPATVARIRREARRLAYRPSVAALALRGGTTRTIVVLVKDFADPFFGLMLAELDRLARRSGLSLVMRGLERGPGTPGGPALLDRYRPDGLLLVGSDFLPGEAARCLKDGVPVVRLGTDRGMNGVPQVAMDERAGLARLAAYLRRLGHARIGYLADTHARSRRREAALREALDGLGAEPAPAVGRRVWSDPAEARRLVAAAGAPSAWIAFDDLAAIRCLRVWRAAGIDVPGRISIAGVDDIPAAALVTPALTTLRQPVQALVRAAFRLLRATEPAAAGERFGPVLVARASCARREGTVAEQDTEVA